MTQYQRRKRIGKGEIQERTHLVQCPRCYTVKRVWNTACRHEGVAPLICEQPCGCKGVPHGT